MSKRAWLLAATAWLWPGMAQAQTATTSIVPDAAGSGLATGTTAARAGATTTIDGGRFAGGNLFHSFRTFQLGPNETARWETSLTASANVRNVINRVTGGDVSRIDGRLDSTALPNAAFFFINPAGIVFGSGAQVNVPGAAHFSTASALRFADGATFSATTANGSTFTAAAPQSFGFLGQSGDITIRAGNLRLPTATLDLTAANVRAAAMPDTLQTISAERLRVVAAGDGAVEIPVSGAAELASLSGEVSLRHADWTAVANGEAVLLQGGAIRLDDARIDVEPAEGFAEIEIGSHRMSLIRGAQISASSQGGGDAGNVRIATGTLVLDGSNSEKPTGIIASANADSPRNAGRISIRAEDITLRDGAQIGSVARGSGQGGVVDIAAHALSMVDGFIATSSFGLPGTISIALSGTLTMTGGRISNSARGMADAGPIRISAGSVLLQRARIDSEAPLIGSSGNGGDIRFVVSGDIRIDRKTTITTDTLGLGDAGSVSIRSATLSLADKSRISSSTSSSSETSKGGTIDVIADRIDVTDGSAIKSDTSGAADAGRVRLEADRLNVSGASVTSETTATGNAGRLEIRVGALSIADGAKVSTSTSAAGNAGAIDIAAVQLLLAGGSIKSSSNSVGNAGSVGIHSAELSLADNSSISSSTSSTSAESMGGTIDVIADRIDVRDGSAIKSDTSGAADAGLVSLKAGRLSVSGGSVTSETRATGNAGRLVIRAGALSLDGQGVLSSSTMAGGDAGTIDIDAAEISIADGAQVTTSTAAAGDAGSIRMKSGRMLLASGSISSSSDGVGDAGSVSIHSPELSLADHSSISSSTSSTNETNKGGTIDVTADRIDVTDGSAIKSDTSGAADAGRVSLKADRLNVSGGSVTSETTATGDAGTIDIAAAEISVANAGQVTTSTSAAGAAGNLTLEAARLRLADSSSIASRSRGCEALSCVGGKAGSVSIAAPDIEVGRGSTISTASASAGEPGRISIAAHYLALRDGGSITTNSAAAAAGAITITMADEQGILILDSHGEPSVITTSSPPGSAGMITIANPLAVISNGGSILAKGPLGGANVVIRSRYFIQSFDRPNIVTVNGAFLLDSNVFDVSTGTAAPSVSFLDASRVLSGQCAGTRSSGEVSRLGGRTTGPFAPLPPALPPAPASSSSSGSRTVDVAAVEASAPCL